MPGRFFEECPIRTPTLRGWRVECPGLTPSPTQGSETTSPLWKPQQAAGETIILSPFSPNPDENSCVYGDSAAAAWRQWLVTYRACRRLSRVKEQQDSNVERDGDLLGDRQIDRVVDKQARGEARMSETRGEVRWGAGRKERSGCARRERGRCVAALAGRRRASGRGCVRIARWVPNPPPPHTTAPNPNHCTQISAGHMVTALLVHSHPLHSSRSRPV